MKIDLNVYHEKGTIVLSGRPKGEALRRDLNLDKLDGDSDSVEVIVPKEVVSLNSSFFSGLFEKSIRAMGAEKFRAKYLFNCRTEIRDDVSAGIEEALNTSDPLSTPSK